jgi:Lon protease-like protein
MTILLHVFEPRYQEMVEYCMRTQKTFGVVLVQKGTEAGGDLPEPHRIGCTAEILELEPLEQGRMNLKAVGRERFQIQSLSRDLAFLTGNIVPLEMAGETVEIIEEARDRLRPWVDQYVMLLAKYGQAKRQSRPLPLDPEKLANLSAAILQIPLKEKQELLESDRITDMMRSLGDLYRREISLMEAILSRDPQHQIGRFSAN